MKLRIVNYRDMSGGAMRFCVQLVKALQDGGGVREIEFVSHGAALATAMAAFSEYGIGARPKDIPARALEGVRGFVGFSVPSSALESCDIAWVPWSHGHRVPREQARRVVASFHDALMFTEPQLALRYPAWAADERETVRQWLESPAAMVCSSRFSIDVLVNAFNCAPGRMTLVPITGWHARTAARADLPPQWPWLSAPYLLCPANTFWHKNHETLLDGYAQSGLTWPLVLTGPGSDLVDPAAPLRRGLRRVAVALGLRPPGRAGLLRARARRLGLAMGRNLIGLGNLSDAAYDVVLRNASCVVMPTLGEGGGSFPVEEALLAGVPVVCSDIPVLREQAERLGAEVAWFDPLQPGHLCARLRELAADPGAARERARAQVGRLHPRTWAAVADDYLEIFRSRATPR